MIQVNIAVLKAKLSHYLGQVKNGGEILVMDRNTPVAKLVASAGAGQALLLTPPARSPAALKTMKPLRAKRKTDSAALLRDERERR